MDKKRIGIISLGCDKNRVDTEKMLALINEKHIICNNIRDIDILIINTCAFIRDARQETLKEINTALNLKKHNKIEKIIVTGCFVQLINNGYNKLLEQVDACLGVSNYASILNVIEDIYKTNECIKLIDKPKNEKLINRVLTTNYYAYLKISDGCNNCCSFCKIPSIKGCYKSIPINDLLKEASQLGDLYELILVAQNVANYGCDLQNNITIVTLIQELSKLDNIKHIRLLYCYPEDISDELINEYKHNPKLIKYIDMPLQHANNEILKLMNRKGTAESYYNLIKKLKTEIPNIAIRSTFMVGFPQENKKCFYDLVKFIKKIKIFNIGFMKYSKELNTKSYTMPNHVLLQQKNNRLKKIYEIQKRIVLKRNKQLINTTINVIIEKYNKNCNLFVGRAYFNAPEIDGSVYITYDDSIQIGQEYKVLIIKYNLYDLYAKLFNENHI